MALKQIAATALTDSSATAVEEPGQIRVEANGKMYRYVRNCGSKTLVKGNAVNLILASANYYQVCASRPATSANAGGAKNAPAGILPGSIRKGQYGWAQFKGNFLGTTARISNGAATVGCRVGLACGQTSRLRALSGTVASPIGTVIPIGVMIGTASGTYAKGIYLYGV